MTQEHWFVQSLRRHIMYPSRLLVDFEFVSNGPGEHRFAWEGGFICRRCGKLAMKTEEQQVRGMFVVIKITCYECRNMYEITKDEMQHIMDGDAGCDKCRSGEGEELSSK